MADREQDVCFFQSMGLVYTCGELGSVLVNTKGFEIITIVHQAFWVLVNSRLLRFDFY
jgi:hypothetical protein